MESPTVTTGGGGAIRANGASSIDCSGQAGGGGSGGAIYIKSNSFTGSGGISATGGGSTGGNGRIVIHTLNYTHNGSNPITPTAITTTKDLVETACTAPENGSCTATCPGGYSLFQIKYVKYGASACDSGINSFGSGANCELGPASSNSTSATTTFNNARCIDNCVGTVKAGILIIKCEAN